MKVRRFVAASVAAVLVGFAIPVAALAVTDAYGREYAGQARCLECHDGLLASNRTIYSTSAHSNTVVDVRANPSKLVPSATSTAFWPSPGFGTSGLRFGPANVYLMFGSGTRKSFIGVPGEALPALSPVATVPLPSGTPADDLARFSGASFETATNTWSSTGPTSTRSWYQSCGACHNTGVTRASIDTVQLASGAWMTPSTPSTATFISIQCEACHGTGSSAVKHDGETPGVLAWTSSNDAPGRLMSAEVCGQCHVNGTTTQRTFAGTGTFSQPNGYTPDETLTAYFAVSSTVPTEGQYLASPASYKFYPNGSNRNMSYGTYNEWLQNKIENGFGHMSPTNASVKRSTNPKCLRCHSGEGFLEYANDPIVPVAFNASTTNVKWGITCQVCHAPHDPTNGQTGRRSSNPAIGRVGCSDCHNWQYEVLDQTPPTEEAYESGLAAVRVSHPQREMIAGTGLFGVPAASEFMPGVRCSECHMPETAGAGQASHRFHVMLPGKAELWGVRQGGDSCTPCHPSTSREDLQVSIDGWQDETEALLDDVTSGMAESLVRMGWTGTESAFNATTSVDPDVVAYKKAYHNRMYVNGDASLGVHNPPYAKAGLDYALYLIRTIGGSVTLSGPAVGQYGMDITVVGTALMGDGTPAAGERIEIQARKFSEADFTTVALTDTNGLGAYNAAYRLTERTELRAVWMCEGTERVSPTIEVSIGSYGGLTPVDRVWAEDRYGTAAEASKAFFKPGSVANVVLASGASFPDALSASGLAGVAGGPLLLTAPDALPAATFTEIQRVSVEPSQTTIWIVGGEQAVAPAVDQALLGAGYKVNRNAGVDRYETAARVAGQIAAVLGESFSGDAFVVNGRAFPDGLSVGPAAYANGIPVLLTEAATLPNATSTAIAANGIARALVVGGTAAVSEAVLAQLPAGSERVAAGADRYGTATAFATWAHGEGLLTYGVVGIASGAAFPDALSAGPPIGASGGVLLLTPPESLPAGVATFLTDNAEQIGRAVLFGGRSALSDTVRTGVYDCLND